MRTTEFLAALLTAQYTQFQPPVIDTGMQSKLRHLRAHCFTSAFEIGISHTLHSCICAGYLLCLQSVPCHCCACMPLACVELALYWPSLVLNCKTLRVPPGHEAHAADN